MKHRIALSFLNISNWDYPFTLELTELPLVNGGGPSLAVTNARDIWPFGAIGRRVTVIYRALYYVQQVLIERTSERSWPEYVSKDPSRPVEVIVTLVNDDVHIDYHVTIGASDLKECLKVSHGEECYCEEREYCSLHDGRKLVESIVNESDPKANSWPAAFVNAAQYLRLFFFEFLKRPLFSPSSGSLLSICADPQMAEEVGCLVVREADFFSDRLQNWK